MIASSPVELIKEKLDIVEFLKGYLQIQPAGKNFKALCPFHREKTPSFIVSPDRQSWHCFGCSLGGDAFAFLMRYENMEFSEVLRVLAEKTGVELRRLNPAEYKYTGLLYDLNETAKKFFQSQLTTAKVAQIYLAERKLTKTTIEEFELGWAPEEMEALNLYLINAGHQPEDIVRAGLAFKSERGLQMDRFRGRIMFPIHNHLGRVVGFTGRILPQLDNGTTGKYINSPETSIFSKSKLLYGFWKSKEFIRRLGSVFVVEGQMDFLMSYQAGVKNAVASSGTAFTVDHLRALRRLADTLLLNFDNDAAGWAAGERVIDAAQAYDFSVKVVTLGEAKDAAEVAAESPEKLKQMVAIARPAMAVYMERYLPDRSADYSARENLKNLRVILSKIKNIASPVERSFWLKELAGYTGVAEVTLSQEMEATGTNSLAAVSPKETSTDSSPAREYSRWERIAQKLLAAAVVKNDVDIVPEKYLPETCLAAWQIISSGQKSSADPAVDALLNLIFLSAENIVDGEIKELRVQLHGEYIKEKRAQLVRRVHQAQTAGDEPAIHAALRELQELNVLGESET